MTSARASDPGRTLVGAAVATTTAAAAPPPAPAPPDPGQRRYRLRAGEAISDGIRRVAGGQLAGAAEELAGADEAELGGAVHGGRKRIKRVRAALRLSHGAIGEQFGAELPAGATVEMRARLHDEHERALEALKAEDTAGSGVEALADAAARTAQWDFARDDFAALEPDLRRI